ncbi:MAG: hypothetical protein DHS20C07_30060 [Methyloligella sp.]|jgi:transcriptional regulator with XRE-family HTH domain|nr:MAG: hypothetical protein DHS20C07_30060 [Methyloligella sp.]
MPTNTHKILNIQIGHRIRKQRKICNKSQTDLAEVIGVTFQQIQKYENGTNRVSAATLYSIAKVLELSITYFYGDVADIIETSELECIVTRFNKLSYEKKMAFLQLLS